MSDSREEHAALVALLRALPAGASWRTVSDQVLERGSAIGVWDAADGQALLPDPARATALAEAGRDVDRWAATGARLLSVLDEDYPAALREVHQAPPFLFARGAVVPDDVAVAVVGSRAATERSLDIARAVAGRLVDRGVTVLSGLAAGIDTAAHRAALDAGGRTVAVIGTGVERAYPAGNADLQQRIGADGLVLSQFWPDAPPQRRHFLMRNAVMSGYGRATVVVQAGEHSGARSQARMAVEHGRPVILVDQVVADTDWAKQLCGRPGVSVASSLDETMRHVDEALARDHDADELLRGLSGTSL